MFKHLRLEGILENTKGLFKNVTEGTTGLFNKKQRIEDLGYDEVKIELDKMTEVVATLKDESEIQQEKLDGLSKEKAESYMVFKQIEEEYKEAKQRFKDLESDTNKLQKHIKKVNTVLEEKEAFKRELKDFYDAKTNRLIELKRKSESRSIDYDPKDMVTAIKKRIHYIFDAEKAFSDRETISLNKEGFLEFLYRKPKPTMRSRIEKDTKDVKYVIETSTDSSENVLYITRITSESVDDIGTGTSRNGISSFKWNENLSTTEIAEIQDVLERSILKSLEYLERDYSEQVNAIVIA